MGGGAKRGMQFYAGGLWVPQYTLGWILKIAAASERQAAGAGGGGGGAPPPAS